MPTVTSLRERALGRIEPVLLVLFGAVGFVLLIACVKVANLLLARGEDREREMAIRTALGVSTAVNNGIPLFSGGTESGALPDSRPRQEESVASCLYQVVSPNYFRVLGIPLLGGRDFTSQDREGQPLVAIIDEAMAREFWPDEDPIGLRVAFEWQGSQDAPEPVWREVVGVVGHVRHYEWGIFGVLSYVVSRRTHEIGVRLALGALRRDVIRLILRRSLVWTGVGLGIGMATALAATRVLASTLFEVSTTDPVTFGGVTLLLTVVAILASYVPAHRASRVDPVVALRYE